MEAPKNGLKKAKWKLPQQAGLIKATYKLLHNGLKKLLHFQYG